MSGGGWSQNDSDILSRIDTGTGRPISSLILFSGGKRMATFCQGDNIIRLWNTENDQLVEMNPLIEQPQGGGVGRIVAIAASRDGEYVISANDDGKLAIWSLTTTHPSCNAGELTMEGSITALDISPDSLSVAVGSEDGTVAIWSIEKQEQLGLLGPLSYQDSSPVSSVKFSPAGGRIASAYRLVGGDNCSIRIWHSRTGTQLESICDAQSAYSLAWSADGRRLFAGGPGGLVKCFDLSTRTRLPEWRAPFRDLVPCLCVSHNDQFLISISSGRAKFIDIWDIRNIRSVECLSSHNGVVIGVASPDGTRLISVERDNQITMRYISAVIDRSYLFRHLLPLTRQSEPFTYISNTAYSALKNRQLAEAEGVLTREIEDLRYRDFVQYGHANRALVRLRRHDWLGALEDVDVTISNSHRTPLIAYVVKTITLRGQGKIDGATCVFESTFGNCDDGAKQFVDCIMSIAFFDVEGPEKGCYGTDIPNDLPDIGLGRLVKARKCFLLAERYVNKQDYGKALKLSEAAPNLSPLLGMPEVDTISLIFGWDLHDLISGIHELRCRALLELRGTPGLLGYFSAKEADLSEELEAVMAELSSISEGFGDEAKSLGRHNEAITWYTEALALTGCSSDISNSSTSGNGGLDPDNGKAMDSLPRCPQCTAHLFVKRSEAEAAMGLWDDALTDANWAIKRNPSYPLGYQRKYAALCGMGCSKEASAALSDMSNLVSNIDNPEIRELHMNYWEKVKEIDKLVGAISDSSPFVLIHVTDGRLCNRTERIRRFKDDPTFHELVSSESVASNTDRIKEVVERYFQYVMFSHTWDESEPSFEDVSGKSVYDLQNEKLRKFCETVRDHYKPYQWSWSDTCCIDKKNMDVYQKSIRSMYKWYQNSALTIVRLAHPSRSHPSGSLRLEHNRWMFRAWTLQELLAPEIIRFYDHNWELYLHDDNINHKTSLKIKPELARAIGIESDALVRFSPEALPVRQRLRLASTREASVKVDIAYSLIGIFSSDIHVEYTREADIALGLLLQERVNRQGDVTVLDWVGQPSKFHSSIPKEISVYSQCPYAIPSITDYELDHRVEVLKATLPEWDVTRLYNNLTALAFPRFADRRLSLPCITFSIIDIRPDTSDNVPVQDIPTYLASTAALGYVGFKTKDILFSEPQGRRVVLVYPWIRDLLSEIRRRGGDEYTQALKLVVYLEQGFRALLFVERSHQQYKRAAADMEISVSARELTSLEGSRTEVLEIWETL